MICGNSVGRDLKSFYTTIEEWGKYGDLLKKRLTISLKNARLSFTFDLARRGILFVTRRNNVSNCTDEIRRQLQQNNSSMQVLFSEKDRLFADFGTVKIKKQNQFINVLDEVSKPFILVWHKQKGDRFDYRLLSRKCPYALFVVTSVEELQDMYVTNVVDKDVFDGELYKHFREDWDVMFDNGSITTKLDEFSYEAGNNALIII